MQRYIKRNAAFYYVHFTVYNSNAVTLIDYQRLFAKIAEDLPYALVADKLS